LTKRETDFNVLNQFAIDVIQEMGRQALEFYGGGKAELKFDASLITDMELRLMESFKAKLKTHFPEHLAFVNTHENLEYSHAENRYLWIYDPLDGVANFQAGIPIWGTSLALIENFWPVLGVFYMPSSGDLYTAQAGRDAFWGRRRIQVSGQGCLDDESLLLTYSRFHQHYHPNFPGKIRNFGCTGAHIAFVAMGRAEAAVIANESYQGLAAARVLLEAAGGRISRLDGSEFFLNEFLNGQKIEEPLLAGAPEICPQVGQCLEPCAF